MALVGSLEDLGGLFLAAQENEAMERLFMYLSAACEADSPIFRRILALECGEGARIEARFDLGFGMSAIEQSYELVNLKDANHSVAAALSGESCGKNGGKNAANPSANLLANPPANLGSGEILEESRGESRTESQTPESAPNIKHESHKRFVDFQLCVFGAEALEVGSAGDFALSVSYDEARDVAFYQRLRPVSRLVLRAGDLAVFFPSDIHAGGIKLDASAANLGGESWAKNEHEKAPQAPQLSRERVFKTVVKVPYSLFDTHKSKSRYIRHKPRDDAAESTQI